MFFNTSTYFIALRYLKPSKDHGMVSIISLFSFLGIALGVGTLIIVMSVMNGFRIELLDKIIGLNGHLSIYANQDSKNLNYLKTAKAPFTIFGSKLNILEVWIFHIDL